MRFAVIVFPGTSGDVDIYHAIHDALGCRAEYVRHSETSLEGFDAVLLPGGFSYGDYLRCGAMAAVTNIVPAIKEAAYAGKPVLGVGNGFQILTEIGLLPGAFRHNQQMRFVCCDTTLKVEQNQTMFTEQYKQGEHIQIPVAHGMGNYYADAATIRALKETRRIVFTYQSNPNGSVEHIAGIMNEAGNVLGMMPRPERAVESLLGSEDGLRLFQSILQTRGA